MSNFWSAVLKFLGQADSAVKGKVNGQEFFHTIILALASGGTVVTIITTILGAANTFITDPSLLNSINTLLKDLENKDYAAIVVMVLTFAVDLWRRYNQGKPKVVDVK